MKEKTTTMNRTVRRLSGETNMIDQNYDWITSYTIVLREENQQQFPMYASEIQF